MTEVNETLDEKFDLDLDASVSAEAESRKKPVNIKVNGNIYSIPVFSEWPAEALDAASWSVIEPFELLAEDDDTPEVTDELVEVIKKMKTDKVKQIFEHLHKVSGVDPGKLRRSGNPSLNGGKKSKRT